ncbi:MAG: UDP-glucose 4-epimerase GalE [Cyclobacteriaceae bacterium]
MTLPKKILVTGGAGYIGSHTVVALANAGYEAIVIDDLSNSKASVISSLEQILQTPITFYQHDCNDPSFLNNVFEKEERIVGAIHFAAFKAVGESVAYPLKYYRNNLDSLITLLSTMKMQQVAHLVFSSSCTVYGQPEQLPVTEESPRKNAESPYGNTKKISEDIIEDVVKSKAPLKSMALRYFNPVGADSSALIGELPLGTPSNLVPYITQTAAGLRESVTIFGGDYNTHDGTCIRDYIHVTDLAEAHVKALQFLEAESAASYYDAINVGTGQGHTVLEVVKAFEKVSGQALNYRIGDRRDGDIEQIYANVDKATKMLGWTASRSLEEALSDSWNWQQKLQHETAG